MCENPVVSIIMPSYNSSKYIGEAIQSVINQSFENWELIIVDDCSSDNSVDVIRDFSQLDQRIFFISQSVNSGAAISRNIAISKSKGRYIAFLDSDDIWNSDKLAEQMLVFSMHSPVIVFSYYDVMREDGSILSCRRPFKNEIAYEDMLFSNHIGCLTCVYDTFKIGKILMPEIRMRQDWGLWLSILKKSEGTAICVQKSLAKLRLRPNSLSANKFKAMYYNYILLSKYANLDKFVAILYVFIGAFKALIRKYTKEI